MLLLKKELSEVGNNFNQAVHKFHLLDKIPEFRVWIKQYDFLHKSLIAKVDEIKLRVNQFYEKWLQKYEGRCSLFSEENYSDDAKNIHFVDLTLSSYNLSCA